MLPDLEEIVRAWFANPTTETDRAFVHATSGFEGYLLPSGRITLDPSEHNASWLAWAKADAAKRRP